MKRSSASVPVIEALKAECKARRQNLRRLSKPYAKALLPFCPSPNPQTQNCKPSSKTGNTVTRRRDDICTVPRPRVRESTTLGSSRTPCRWGKGEVGRRSLPRGAPGGAGSGARDAVHKLLPRLRFRHPAASAACLPHPLPLHYPQCLRSAHGHSLTAETGPTCAHPSRAQNTTLRVWLTPPFLSFLPQSLCYVYGGGPVRTARGFMRAMADLGRAKRRQANRHN